MAIVRIHEIKRLGELLKSNTYKRVREQFPDVTAWDFNCKAYEWEIGQTPEILGEAIDYAKPYDYVLDLTATPGAVTNVTAYDLLVTVPIYDSEKYGIRCIVTTQYHSRLPADVVTLLTDMKKIVDSTHVSKALVC